MVDNPSLFAATLYCAWTILLLGGIAALRGTLTVRRVKPANSFAVGGEDVSPFSARLCRAHANCYESLPASLGILLVAQWLDLGAVTDGLAFWFVGTRIAQSITHLISTSVRAVTIRFFFFLAQYLIILSWTAQILLFQIL